MSTSSLSFGLLIQIEPKANRFCLVSPCNQDLQFSGENEARAGKGHQRRRRGPPDFRGPQRKPAARAIVLRVTADTNILVSGLNFARGKPFELLELARTGKVNPTISEALPGEMEDVLRRKFGWNEERIAAGAQSVPG
jgi:hypothetical protein